MSNKILPLVLSAVIGLVAGAVGGVIAVRTTGDRPGLDALREQIVANPDIIRDAFAELQRREGEAAAEARKSLIAENADEIFRSPRDFVAGNPDGDVTVVEFFDYNCPYCKRAVDDMNRLLESDPKLRFVLKEFPILGPASVAVSRLAIASQKQGKYLEYHRALYALDGKIDAARALEVAADIGLDVERLEADAADKEVEETIKGVHSLAAWLGINGTPGYVVADEIVAGALGHAVLAEKIAAARERAKTASN